MPSSDATASSFDVEFTFDGLGGVSTCRVQVFTDTAGETVVLATQRLEGEGASLVNAQEQAMEAVSKRLLGGRRPEHWFQVLVPTGSSGSAGLQRVVHVSGDGADAEFGWTSAAIGDLVEVLGFCPDLTRGENAAPVTAPGVPAPDTFRVIAPLLMPVPAPWQARGCMGPRSRRGWGKALVSRPGVGCARAGCSYHGVDWNVACAAAVRALRQAVRDGAAGRGEAARTLLAADLSGDELMAADSLFRDPVALSGAWWRRWRIAYGNGQHRTRAMLDQGVPLTVILARR